ncbi:MAG TPA: hypothetical protein VN214_15295, partial [Pseudomonas sp.]|nr:hypothetical protein [Pseudomonas sp.]
CVGAAAGCDLFIIWPIPGYAFHPTTGAGDEVQEPDRPITVSKVREKGHSPAKSRLCACLTLASTVTFLYRTRPLKKPGKSKCWKHP